MDTIRLSNFISLGVQLLLAVKQSHEKGVCHGELFVEGIHMEYNVMLFSLSQVGFISVNFVYRHR